MREAKVKARKGLQRHRWMGAWKDVVSVYTDVRAVNAVEIYRGITVNNFNNSPIFLTVNIFSSAVS